MPKLPATSFENLGYAVKRRVTQKAINRRARLPGVMTCALAPHVPEGGQNRTGITPARLARVRR